MCLTQFFQRRFTLLLLFPLVLLALPVPASAEQPTATLSSFSGPVQLTLQGVSDIEATPGSILRAGDLIVTGEDAQAVLHLSDGSLVSLDENTSLDVAVLLEEPESKARTSVLKLLYGRFRAFLSQDHQKEGSEFKIETPNAQVGVKFSKPDIEIRYEQSEEITTVCAYTVGISVTNLTSGAQIDQIPKEHCAIVQETFILVNKISEESAMLPDWERTVPLLPEDKIADESSTEALATEQLDMLFGSRIPIAVSIGAAPLVFDTLPATTQNSPGARASRPAESFGTVGFNFSLTEE